jgi:hypothetical protein
MPTAPLEGPKPGIACLACGKATLVLSAADKSWACDKCKRSFSLEAVAEIERLRGVVAEIVGELYGQGFEVAGWHLNGALEPLDTFFDDNGWCEAAEAGGE